MSARGAAALLVKAIVRGLGLSRWIAWLLAAATFAALLAKAVGGLAPLTAALDSAGFTLGSRRFTLLALVQIVIGLLALYALVRFAIRIAGEAIRKNRGLDPTQQLLAQKLAAIAIIAAAFFIGIDLAGIDLTALAVFSGALGLAVGFGLQKTFGNLFAGIILLMDRSIKPGDVISVGESFGSVNKIGVRAVSIVTRDGKEYLIPNELLMTQEVVNWSYSTRDVRISIPVSIAYDCDVKRAQQLMIEAANASPRVLDSPQPAVWMTAFGENALEHEIRVWILDPEAGIGSVRSEILGRLSAALRGERDRRALPAARRAGQGMAASDRLAEHRRQIAERGLERGGEALGRGARRGAAGEQRLDPGGGPERDLGGERLEPALGDRQGARIGDADPRRLVEPAVIVRRGRTPGDSLDLPQRLAQLGELAAGIGARRRGGGRRLMSHGARR